MIYPAWTLTIPEEKSTGQQTPPHHSRPNQPRSTATPAPTAPSATNGPSHAPDNRSDAPAATPRHTPAATDPSPNSPAPHSDSPPGPTGPQADPAPHAQTHGISLPGGSWLDLALASAIVAAAALVWKHRRRHYTRRPPTTDLRLEEPNLAPMPPTVSRIRRSLRHQNTSPSQHDEPRNTDSSKQGPPSGDTPGHSGPPDNRQITMTPPLRLMRVTVTERRTSTTSTAPTTRKLRQTPDQREDTNRTTHIQPQQRLHPGGRGSGHMLAWASSDRAPQQPPEDSSSQAWQLAAHPSHTHVPRSS